MRPAPVVMIHGAFCGGWVFDAFAEPFRAAGHRVLTPDLPGHGSHASPATVAGLSMRDYARATVELIRGLPEPPMLIGHSMGGLVALMAAQKIPTAGIALLAPSPPWGLTASTVEEAVSAVVLYALGPYWTQAIQPDYATFSRYGVDRLGRAERHAVFERMGWESGRALFEVLNWWLDPFMTTIVRADRIKAPILALAGERDVIHPPTTVRASARKLGALVEVLPQMSHWLPGEPEWAVVAERCLRWAAQAAAIGARAPA